MMALEILSWWNKKNCWGNLVHSILIDQTRFLYGDRDSILFDYPCSCLLM